MRGMNGGMAGGNIREPAIQYGWSWGTMGRMSAPPLDPASLRDALRDSSARLTPGLSEAELADLETRFEIEFAPDHRQLLGMALPLGDDGRWPDWRDAPEADLRGRLSWPTDGLLFDVEHNDLWIAAWGDRPADTDDALSVATRELALVPRLVPIYAHRYVPTTPKSAGNPVLSCYQADIICYGADLLDWFSREFHRHGTSWPPFSQPLTHLPFWTQFLEAD